MLEHDWQVDYDAVLGSGAFGIVYRGKLATAGVPIAVKCIDLSDDVCEEVRLQQMCAHPRILRVIDSCENGVKRFAALEFCPHGDLSDLIRDKSALGFVLDEMVGYMLDLLSAVAHVHRCGIVHRDIKPANVLCQAVSGQPCLQLRFADFGLAAVCPASGHSLVGHGTLSYMPVEQLLGFCNSACDVWACGCILFELLMRDILVPGSSSYDHNAVLGFLRGESLDAKLDDVVLCYGRNADISIVLLKFSTLDCQSVLLLTNPCSIFQGGPVISAIKLWICRVILVPLMLSTHRLLLCLRLGFPIGPVISRLGISLVRMTLTVRRGVFHLACPGRGVCIGRRRAPHFISRTNALWSSSRTKRSYSVSNQMLLLAPERRLTPVLLLM